LREIQQMQLSQVQPIIAISRKEPFDDPDWLFEFNALYRHGASDHGVDLPFLVLRPIGRHSTDIRQINPGVL
jgi:hypothetical protein